MIEVVFTSQHAQLRTLPKKVQKQERKIIKNEKRCRNGMPNVHEQERIEVMVNIQSPIPTSLLFCEKM